MKQVSNIDKPAKKQHFLSDDTTVESPKQMITSPQPYQHLPFKSASLIGLEGVESRKGLALNFMISHVICKIQSNKCYYHSYLVFYMPAILMIAKQLSMYIDQKHLHSYKLFTFLIKRVMQISKDTPKQMEDEEIMNYLTIAINYHKDISKVERALSDFLMKNQSKMKGFMPIYYLYFKMIADKDKLITVGGIEEAKHIISTVETQFDRYRSKQL